MSVEDNLAAAGHAVDELQQAVKALSAVYGPGVDLHRLQEDVSRLCTDLDLLRESRPDLVRTSEAPEPAGTAPADYDPAYLADTDSEDQAGAGGRPAS
jgi:hypothetical protein